MHYVRFQAGTTPAGEHQSNEEDRVASARVDHESFMPPLEQGTPGWKEFPSSRDLSRPLEHGGTESDDYHLTDPSRSPSA